jgi:hypothetical protein
MVHAYQAGHLKHAPAKIKQVAKHVSKTDATHFAETKHKHLPEKKGFDISERLQRLMLRRGETPEQFDAVIRPSLAAMYKQAAGPPGIPARLLSHYVPIGGRRESFSPDEQSEIDQGQSQWLPKVIKTDATRIPQLMASPAKQGLLQALLGAGLGAGSGYFAGKHLGSGTHAGLGAALGGLGVGAASGIHGFINQHHTNDDLTERMRRLPPGSTKRDLDNEEMLNDAVESRFKESGEKVALNFDVSAIKDWMGRNKQWLAPVAGGLAGAGLGAITGGENHRGMGALLGGLAGGLGGYYLGNHPMGAAAPPPKPPAESVSPPNPAMSDVSWGAHLIQNSPSINMRRGISGVSDGSDLLRRPSVYNIAGGVDNVEDGADQLAKQGRAGPSFKEAAAAVCGVCGTTQRGAYCPKCRQFRDKAFHRKQADLSGMIHDDPGADKPRRTSVPEGMTSAQEDCPSCGAALEMGDSGNCNQCGKPWPLKKTADDGTIYCSLCKDPWPCSVKSHVEALDGKGSFKPNKEKAAFLKSAFSDMTPFASGFLQGRLAIGRTLPQIGDEIVKLATVLEDSAIDELLDGLEKLAGSFGKVLAEGAKTIGHDAASVEHPLTEEASTLHPSIGGMGHATQEVLSPFQKFRNTSFNDAHRMAQESLANLPNHVPISAEEYGARQQALHAAPQGAAPASTFHDSAANPAPVASTFHPTEAPASLAPTPGHPAPGSTSVSGAPLPPVPSNGVPSQMTGDMTQRLQQLGTTEEEISRITPAQAHEIINGKPTGAVAPAAQAPSAAAQAPSAAAQAPSAAAQAPSAHPQGAAAPATVIEPPPLAQSNPLATRDKIQQKWVADNAQRAAAGQQPLPPIQHAQTRLEAQQAVTDQLSRAKQLPGVAEGPVPSGNYQPSMFQRFQSNVNPFSKYHDTSFMGGNAGLLRTGFGALVGQDTGARMVGDLDWNDPESYRGGGHGILTFLARLLGGAAGGLAANPNIARNLGADVRELGGARQGYNSASRIINMANAGNFSGQATGIIEGALDPTSNMNARRDQFANWGTRAGFGLGAAGEIGRFANRGTGGQLPKAMQRVMQPIEHFTQGTMAGVPYAGGDFLGNIARVASPVTKHLPFGIGAKIQEATGTGQPLSRAGKLGVGAGLAGMGLAGAAVPFFGNTPNLNQLAQSFSAAGQRQQFAGQPAGQPRHIQLGQGMDALTAARQGDGDTKMQAIQDVVPMLGNDPATGRPYGDVLWDKAQHNPDTMLQYTTDILKGLQGEGDQAYAKAKEAPGAPAAGSAPAAPQNWADKLVSGWGGVRDKGLAFAMGTTPQKIQEIRQGFNDPQAAIAKAVGLTPEQMTQGQKLLAGMTPEKMTQLQQLSDQAGDFAKDPLGTLMKNPTVRAAAAKNGIPLEALTDPTARRHLAIQELKGAVNDPEFMPVIDDAIKKATGGTGLNQIKGMLAAGGDVTNAIAGITKFMDPIIGMLEPLLQGMGMSTKNMGFVQKLVIILGGLFGLGGLGAGAMGSGGAGLGMGAIGALGLGAGLFGGDKLWGNHPQGAQAPAAKPV